MKCLLDSDLCSILLSLIVFPVFLLFPLKVHRDLAKGIMRYKRMVVIIIIIIMYLSFFWKTTKCIHFQWTHGRVLKGNIFQAALVSVHTMDDKNTSTKLYSTSRGLVQGSLVWNHI